MKYLTLGQAADGDVAHLQVEAPEHDRDVLLALGLERGRLHSFGGQQRAPAKGLHCVPGDQRPSLSTSQPGQICRCPEATHAGGDCWRESLTAPRKADERGLGCLCPALWW